MQPTTSDNTRVKAQVWVSKDRSYKAKRNKSHTTDLAPTPNPSPNTRGGERKSTLRENPPPLVLGEGLGVGAVFFWCAVCSGWRYKFAEQDSDLLARTPNTGVCFSGGGTRALSAAMGQLRGLTH